jgi:hypothetical protein
MTAWKLLSTPLFSFFLFSAQWGTNMALPNMIHVENGVKRAKRSATKMHASKNSNKCSGCPGRPVTALPNVHSKALLRVQLVRLPPLPLPDLPQHTWQMREDIGRLGRESIQNHHMIRLELVAVKNCGTPSYLYLFILGRPSYL